MILSNHDDNAYLPLLTHGGIHFSFNAEDLEPVCDYKSAIEQIESGLSRRLGYEMKLASTENKGRSIWGTFVGTKAE